MKHPLHTHLAALVCGLGLLLVGTPTHAQQPDPAVTYCPRITLYPLDPDFKVIQTIDLTVTRLAHEQFVPCPIPLPCPAPSQMSAVVTVKRTQTSTGKQSNDFSLTLNNLFRILVGASVKSTWEKSVTESSEVTWNFPSQEVPCNHHFRIYERAEIVATKEDRKADGAGSGDRERTKNVYSVVDRFWNAKTQTYNICKDLVEDIMPGGMQKVGSVRSHLAVRR